ncbi:ferritin-like domain-containing protein [uncultured Abyssibacter sp.]|uniref:ferritin-like domain-containing protein n=1 Tax=uncultured Abyssibacter sp. TaxID=2320202 RepID=UPI0032B211FE
MGGQSAVLAAYLADDPVDKCARVMALAPDDAGPLAGPMPDQPGRPAAPLLIHPAKVPKRKLGSPAGRAALVHAVAHIEFNAINLALDAVLRFAGMPEAYYRDWLSVARDEARHFTMLSGRLAELETAYGDLPAHNGLWEMAEKTAHDPLHRMALVPRVLEARGLDVTPGMIERLLEAGDNETVAHLRVILAEEVRHVDIGSRWFRFLCERRGQEPGDTFHGLLDRYGVTVGRGPLNLPARRRAGFSEQELELIAAG